MIFDYNYVYFYIQNSTMKKTISFVCGILVLCMIAENINFIYAEDETNTLLTIEKNLDEDKELIANVTPNNLKDDNKTEEVTADNEEISAINEEISESADEDNINSLDKGEEIQTFEIKQATQTIETSDYGIIRIKDPNNPWKWITIHDRNLWASATWAGVDESRDSFGYYFQWWNNYWFPSTGDIEKTTTTQVDASSYWPNTDNWYYSSDTFIKWNNDWSSVRNDNLRWWNGDSKDGNGRWYPLTNQEDRRGPCPENYHVPSIWEWSKLIEFRAAEYGSVSLSRDGNGLYKFWNDNQEAMNEFYSSFFVPKAWWRDNSATINNSNTLLLYWTSSPSGVYDAFRLYWDSSIINGQYINKREYAFPIRCFYNSYRLPVKITYNVNWWYRVDDESSDDKTITYTKINNNSDFSGDFVLWGVKRDNNCWEDWNKKCIFGWWYTLTGDEMWTWNISEDITLIAKWFTYDDKDISYSGVNFTIMDRNLWAEASWTGGNAYGYYLTWWDDDILCPEWYHIPSTWEWLWIKNLLSGDFNSDSIKDLLNLPFAGKIINNDAIETENAYYLTQNNDEMAYVKISDSDIEIQNFKDWERVSVRCFKDYNTWNIKFYTNGWDSINDISAINRREQWKDLPIPNRTNSHFLWWYNSNKKKIENNVNYKNEEEINLYAKWECIEWYQEKENVCEKIEKKSGWSSGWWGRWSSKDAISNSDSWDEKSTELQTWNKVDFITLSQNDSKSSSWTLTYQTKLDEEPVSVTPMDSSTSSQNDDITYPQEFMDAYNFAYKYWITSKSSIQDAKMYSPLTRIQMAKMLSNYAINVLWKHPDISKWTIKFDDVSNKLNKEYDNAVNLAYQLGIMWQNIKSKRFRPYDEVTRAEFATALSRLLYWAKDWKWKVKYYEPHITKLYNEWIISKNNPNIKEKRWYVMVMLWRNFH